MYPTLFHFFYDVFGLEIEPLKFFPAFGFIVALSFIAAAFFFGKELKRKEQLGFLFPNTEKVLIGKPASISEMAVNGLIGFIFGYKIIGIFFGGADGMDMQDYMFSKHGTWWSGLLLAAVFAYMKYHEKQKDRLPEPKWIDTKIYPSQRVGEITMVAAVSGIVGAKIFHQLEEWDNFIADPIGNLLSPSGLTFYGGLICGAIAVVYYVRKRNMNPWVISDALAPALMLAYAIGRIGCQVSGDGDWGIHNTAPKPGWMSFLPDWMWSYNFPHNVNNDDGVVGDIIMADCGKWAPYCHELQTAVFPTAFYETLMGLMIFGILWMIRKRISVPGMMFCIYLVLNGIERFSIEKIRVNTTMEFFYDSFGLMVTQAEFISFMLMILGFTGIIYFKMTAKKAQ